jgi:hypothetical protein
MLSIFLLSVIMLSVFLLILIMLSVFLLILIMLSVFMLSVIMLNVVMLSIIMINVVMPNFIMLSVFMLSVIMLNVVMLIVPLPFALSRIARSCLPAPSFKKAIFISVTTHFGFNNFFQQKNIICCREPSLKGTDKYDWPPLTNYFKTVDC